jgi:hypothetical protein
MRVASRCTASYEAHFARYGLVPAHYFGEIGFAQILIHV